MSVAGGRGGDGTPSPVASPRPNVADPLVRSSLADAQALLIGGACSVLDLIQDPWAVNFDENHRPIACELLARASGYELVVMAPERVFAEIGEHAGRLLGDTARNLEGAARRTHRGHDVLERDGVSAAPAPIRIGAYLDIVDDAYRSWLAAMAVMPTSDAARLRALERIDRHHAPSSPDKPEVWDCVITETVLKTMRALRADGLDQPCAFLSSNVADYRRSSKEGPHQARDPLQSEFDALSIRYASRFGQVCQWLFP